ncbi:MAG: aminodeoxychorismate synthase component I [Planctomycetota bacterium]|jgi:para-aminobenzoate synthetase component 1
MRLELPDLGPLRAERCDFPPPSARLVSALRGTAHAALLDSACGGRYTVLGVSPLARITWRPGRGEVLLPGGARAREDSPTDLLRAALSTTALHRVEALPLGPGWIGCLGYGLRVAFEDVPERHPDETGIADLDLAYYPAVAVFDGHAGHDGHDAAWWILWRDAAGDAARTLRAVLSTTAPAPEGGVDRAPEPRIARAEYLAAVERAVEYVHAGDIFQVNYAHEFSAPCHGDPLALYTALRASNPAPYGAYLELGAGQAILSTSPELFLSMHGRDVTTRPIKGTRPRGKDDADDARLARELMGSEKDEAELAMIVDLERNDLGRVSEPGSVVVRSAAEIESYAAVHHRVAAVTGRLEEGYDRVDLLAASFPGGSITGAPKVRAMEIIDELEAGRRGPYTGSIGILTDEGNMELNIAIRTAVVSRGLVRVHVGGGIVADSEPVAEYEETLAKGHALFAALQP